MDKNMQFKTSKNTGFETSNCVRWFAGVLRPIDNYGHLEPNDDR